VTALAFLFTRAPERRKSRKILAVAALAGLAFAGWQFGETKRGYPYRQETVSFDNRGAHLVGTLYLPKRQGPVPGIVVVHGSGPMPRNNYAGWATQFAGAGHAMMPGPARRVEDTIEQWLARVTQR